MLTTEVGLDDVLPGGGPNLEVRVGTDFSAIDEEFLGTALFESGRISLGSRSDMKGEACEPSRFVTAEFSENPMGIEEALFFWHT